MSEIHRTAEYQKFSKQRRKELNELIKSGQAVCMEKKCYLGRIIMPGQKFDIGHIIPVSQWPEGLTVKDNTAASHQYCNRKAGQAMSTKPKQDKKAEQERFFKW